MTIHPLLKCIAAVICVTGLVACQHSNGQRSDNAAGTGGQQSAAAASPHTVARPTAETQPASNQSSVPVVTFHLAQVKPAQGLARVQLNPEVSLYALPQPVLTHADLAQVVPLQNGQGQVFLRFEFNPQGAGKFANVTRQAVGNYLLLSIRGKLVAVPQIGTAHEDGHFPVGFNSADEAQAIIQMLRQSQG